MGLFEGWQKVTDAHCHVARNESRHFVCDPIDGEPHVTDVRFCGTHPWHCDDPVDFAAMRDRLVEDRRLGVGEIGLDRLHDRAISQRMREVFDAQLEIAAECQRPVVLHGAKCWGEVVRACGRFAGRIPAFLFHGFSRSEGLLPDIFAMNGFVSVGPAVLNGHAVNYRNMVKGIPEDRLLVESDCTADGVADTPSVVEIAMALADLRGTAKDSFFNRLEANASAFVKTLACLAIFAVLGGCATSPMKPTPFYDGDQSVYVGRVENRVNLWPLGYYRDPALSVLWPICSLADDHFAVRPFYSQYRQGGKDSDYDEFNILWPFCQFDLRRHSGWAIPCAWSDDGFAVLPVFWWTKDWFVLGPYATSTTEDTGMLLPLSYWNFKASRFWHLAGLCGYWRGDDFGVSHWTLPFYVKNRSGLFSIPYSRLERSDLTRDFYLCGLGGRETAPDGYMRSWAFPFYYHDRQGLYTPLYGNTEESDWLLPCYYRNRTDFHTLLYSMRDDAKTGEKGALSLPLLSAMTWHTNSCERMWFALAGVVGEKRNASGNRHEHWAFPLYYCDEGRSFCSLPYGWNGGRSDKTNTWYAAGLCGWRSGKSSGWWAFPFYDCRKDADFDDGIAMMAAAKAPDDVSDSFWLSTRNSRDFLYLFDWSETVTGKIKRQSGNVELVHRAKRGNSLLANVDVEHRVTLDGTHRVIDRKVSSTRLLALLYHGESRYDLLAQSCSSSHRVLWRLFDWERNGDNVSLDVFPFYTYDSRPNGYVKHSLLWRLFRNEYDPDAGRKIDVFFIPVWR